MLTQRRSRFLAAAAVIAGSCLPVLAQGDKPQPEAFKGTVLIVEHASLDKIFSDPKDKAFGDALAMLPARIRELPRESKGQMPPEAPGLINLALTTLARPGRLAVYYDGDNPSGGAFGYGVVASALTSGEEDANKLHATISGLMAQNQGGPRPTPSKRFKGMSDIQTPVALLSYGPRKSADGWRYEIIFGTMQDPDLVTKALPKGPDGMEVIASAMFDGRGVGPAAEMAKAFAGNNPEAEKGLARLESMGLSGDHPTQVSYVAGFTKNESLSITTEIGALHKDEKGKTPEVVSLKRSDFAAIPSDVTSVSLTRFADPAKMNSEEITAGFMAALKSFGEQSGAQAEQVTQALEQFEAATGVNPISDVIATFGGAAALYVSDTTGGGGLGSAVGMFEVRDRAKLWSALGKLSTQANMLADKLPIGPGYIRLVSHKDGDTDLMTLRFPGLPVPLEVTFALTSNWLIFAPTPQAAIAASRQASGKGDGGLTANKTFAAAFPDDKKAVSVSFTDTARTFRDGYAFVSLLGSAVANAVRSPVDPQREPGMIVPLYNDLKKDIRCRISYTYYKGNDKISETHSDRSTLVATSATASAMGAIAPLIAIPAAIGAASSARSGRGGPFGLAGPEPYTRLVAHFAAFTTAPNTPEHAMWVLASQGTPVQWKEWSLP